MIQCAVLKVHVWIAEMRFRYARVAQLVEHDLAKVGVAGSSPVSRSSVEKQETLIYKVSCFFVVE